VSRPTCQREERSVTFFFYSNDRYLNGYTSDVQLRESWVGRHCRVLNYGQPIGLTHEIDYSLVTDSRR
jgi:hypothetical protein